MTCQVCHHQFCWMCLGAWSDHGQNSGGFYRCNKYEKELKEMQEYKTEAERREAAKTDLEQYLFHFERYNNY